VLLVPRPHVLLLFWRHGGPDGLQLGPHFFALLPGVHAVAAGGPIGLLAGARRRGRAAGTTARAGTPGRRRRTRWSTAQTPSPGTRAARTPDAGPGTRPPRGQARP